MRKSRKSISSTQNFPVPVHQTSEWKRKRDSWGRIHLSPAVTLLGVELQGHGSRGCRRQKLEKAQKGAVPSGAAINCFALVFLYHLTLYHLPSTENDACCNAVIPPWLNLKLLQRELPCRGRLFMTALHRLWNYDPLPVHS